MKKKLCTITKQPNTDVIIGHREKEDYKIEEMAQGTVERSLQLMDIIRLKREESNRMQYLTNTKQINYEENFYIIIKFTLKKSQQGIFKDR